MQKNRVYDYDGYVLKAGAIIFDNSKILLLYRNKWDDWTLPKGHIEPGESVEEGLYREVKEETGLNIEIIKALPDILYEYPEGDGKVKIKMFLCKPEGELEIEYSDDKLKWFDVQAAKKVLSYENNTELLEKIKEELYG